MSAFSRAKTPVFSGPFGGKKSASASKSPSAVTPSTPFFETVAGIALPLASVFVSFGRTFGTSQSVSWSFLRTRTSEELCLSCRGAYCGSESSIDRLRYFCLHHRVVVVYFQDGEVVELLALAFFARVLVIADSLHLVSPHART